LRVRSARLRPSRAVSKAPRARSSGSSAAMRSATVGHEPSPRGPGPSIRSIASRTSRSLARQVSSVVTSSARVIDAPNSDTILKWVSSVSIWTRPVCSICSCRREIVIPPRRTKLSIVPSGSNRHLAGDSSVRREDEARGLPPQRDRRRSGCPRSFESSRPWAHIVTRAPVRARFSGRSAPGGVTCRVLAIQRRSAHCGRANLCVVCVRPTPRQRRA
jgi:hypothetical protein